MADVVEVDVKKFKQDTVLHIEVISPQESAINWLYNLGLLYSLGLCFLNYKMRSWDKRIYELL